MILRSKSRNRHFTKPLQTVYERNECGMSFIDREVLPGVHHIEDCMGVCFTLITGSKRALLVDAGYGFEDTAVYVRGMTDLPVTLWLTHGHHDHAIGARRFDSARLHPDELPVYRTYASEKWVAHVLHDARTAGISVDESSWRALPMPAPTALQGESINLGGMTAQVIPCPGHTPGSIVVFVPELSLLLTGDDWNPCTWLFFPEAVGVREYRESMRKLLALPFEHVLCPHRTELYPRKMPEDFLNALTDAVITAACPVDTGAFYGIDTREVALPHDQILIFDANKS